MVVWEATNKKGKTIVWGDTKKGVLENLYLFPPYGDIKVSKVDMSKKQFWKRIHKIV